MENNIVDLLKKAHQKLIDSKASDSEYEAIDSNYMAIYFLCRAIASNHKMDDENALNLIRNIRKLAEEGTIDYEIYTNFYDAFGLMEDVVEFPEENATPEAISQMRKNTCELLEKAKKIFSQVI